MHSKNSLVDRWSRLHTTQTAGGYGHSQAISFQAQRLGLFRDYEEMDNDAHTMLLRGKGLDSKGKGNAEIDH